MENNTIISMPQLIELVEKAAGVSNEMSAQFLREFFATIHEALAAGETVKIKGIGTFKPLDDSDDKVGFVPEAELAEAVNAPFAFFEPVALAADVDENALDAIATSEPAKEEPETEESATEEPRAEETVVEEPAVEETVVDEPAVVEPPIEEAVEENVEEESAPEIPEEEYSVEDPAQEEPSEDSELSENSEISDASEASELSDNSVDSDISKDSEDIEEEYVSPTPFPWFWMIWALVIGALIGYAAGFFTHDSVKEKIMAAYAFEEPETPVVEEEDAEGDSTLIVNPSDSVETLEPAPIVEVYDTISTTRFLTTMARKHYGHFEYWVFIYKENADILGHPDRTKSGTVVRIPPVEKYATESTDSANIAAAKRMAREIYAPYM